MPLLPSATYSAWFKKTSSVYRAFAFLFQNPLWRKNVPTGFSLCPFAWLALFSAVIFRPLVYVLLGIHAIIKALRLTRVIEFTDALVCRLMRNTDDNPIFIPTAMGLSIVLVVSLLLFGLGLAAVSCWQIGIFGAFLLPIVLLATLLICGAYASNHRGDRCHVETYVHVVTILCLISAWIFHPAEAYAVFIGAPIDMTKGAGHGLVFAVTEVWKAIVFIIVWCAEGVWASRFIVLSSVIGLGLAAVAGWLTFNSPVFSKNKDKQGEVTDEDVRRLRRSILVKSLWEKDLTKGRNGKWWESFLTKWDSVIDSYLGEPYSYEMGNKLWAEMLPKANAQWVEEQRKQADYDARCQKVSDALAKLVSPIVFVLKQGAIVCSYLWALVKAKKSGACPYIRFQD